MDLVDARYRADSYYEFQRAWHVARTDVVELLKVFTKELRKYLQNEPCDFAKVDEARPRVISLLERLPQLPSQYPKNLREALNSKINRWATSIQNFVRQMADTDEDGRRLAVFNFSEAHKQLDDLWGASSSLLAHSPDYFGIKELAPAEDRSYRHIGELLDVWLDPPHLGQRDIVKYARQRQSERNERIARRVRAAVESVEANDLSVVLPSSGYVEHPLRYYPMAFSVEDACRPELTLLKMLIALEPVRDVTDYFCLMPTCGGCRIGDWGYMVSSSQLERIANDEEPSWVTFAAQELPSRALAALPEMSVSVPIKLNARGQLLGLFATVDWMQRLATELQIIPVKGTRYDEELRRKWTDYLEQRCGEVTALIDDVQHVVGAVGSCETDAYRQLTSLLDHIRANMLPGTFEHIALPDDFEIEQMVDDLFLE